MLKKHMAACLVATAFMVAPALAQTSSAPGASGTPDRPAASSTGSSTMGSPAMQPGSSGSSGSMTGTQSSPTMSQSSSGSSMSGSSSTTSSQSSAMASGQFLNSLQSGQFLASDLIGTKVVGQNNESIGDVNDVVMGKDGKAMGIVVGVGGFLGIGEKDVAIPFDKVNFEARTASNNQNRSAETTGSTSGSTTTGSSSASSSNMSENNLPDRIVLPMTKDELKAAPSFRTSANDDNASGSGSSTTRAPAAGNTNPPAPGSSPAKQ